MLSQAYAIAASAARSRLGVSLLTLPAGFRPGTRVSGPEAARHLARMAAAATKRVNHIVPTLADLRDIDSAFHVRRPPA